MVEAGQQKRHVSAPLRLTACFLSSLLVAPTIASNQAGPLEIKHIMHDSVSGALLVIHQLTLSHIRSATTLEAGCTLAHYSVPAGIALTWHHDQDK